MEGLLGRDCRRRGRGSRGRDGRCHGRHVGRGVASVAAQVGRGGGLHSRIPNPYLLHPREVDVPRGTGGDALVDRGPVSGKTPLSHTVEDKGRAAVVDGSLSVDAGGQLENHGSDASVEGRALGAVTGKGVLRPDLFPVVIAAPAIDDTRRNVSDHAPHSAEKEEEQKIAHCITSKEEELDEVHDRAEDREFWGIAATRCPRLHYAQFLPSGED